MIKKYLYISLGFLCVGLGFIGIVLPGIPTTPLILLSAWFFSRSSKKFESWLVNHKKFGPIINNWQESKAISRNSKLYSVMMIIPTFIITIIFAFSLAIDIILAISGAILCIFIITRPEPLK